MQLIIPNDAEQALIDELSPHASNVGTGVPKGPPERFVRIVQLGGAVRDLVVDMPMLSIEVFDSVSESRARELADELLARVDLAARVGSLGGIPCYRLQVLALPQNFPLPSLPTHFRYITTVVPEIRRRVENS